jgi:DNA-binding MarR family transcriptional regulator
MPGARKLTDDDYHRLLAFRTGLREFLHWSEAQAQAVGLTPAQHQLLLAIRGSEDELGPTISELRDSLLLKHHSAVGLIDRAEQAGLVRRRHDGTDKRLVRVGLTRKGAGMLSRLSAQHLDELEQLAPTFRALLRDADRTSPT